MPDAPLPAAFGDVPAEHAIIGFAGVRAYSSHPERSAPLLDRPAGASRTAATASWRRAATSAAAGSPTSSRRSTAASPARAPCTTSRGRSRSAPRSEWQQRVAAAGARATEVIDRFYFRSVYFREPSGVLFELATRGPGFTADEELETLGEKVALPPFLEPHRERIEASLTPLDAVGGQRVETR